MGRRLGGSCCSARQARRFQSLLRASVSCVAVSSVNSQPRRSRAGNAVHGTPRRSPRQQGGAAGASTSAKATIFSMSPSCSACGACDGWPTLRPQFLKSSGCAPSFNLMRSRRLPRESSCSTRIKNGQLCSEVCASTGTCQSCNPLRHLGPAHAFRHAQAEATCCMSRTAAAAPAAAAAARAACAGHKRAMGSVRDAHSS